MSNKITPRSPPSSTEVSFCEALKKTAGQGNFPLHPQKNCDTVCLMGYIRTYA
ncbi:hypothetical protein ACP6PL_26230 [Dapis sp. BLCC M126]|uniref:hypothetical protein n=1 Tax=Dapis sp. BLCC M126 TaxID=3400189 RepID=UPI003CE683A4